MSNTQHATSAIIRRQSLTASISKACRHCNAPGVFQSSETFIKDYPAIYRPLWAGREVGPICPCCSNNRDHNKELGEVWSKEYRTPGPLRQIVQKVKSLIRK